MAHEQTLLFVLNCCLSRCNSSPNLKYALTRDWHKYMEFDHKRDGLMWLIQDMLENYHAHP